MSRFLLFVYLFFVCISTTMVSGQQNRTTEEVRSWLRSNQAAQRYRKTEEAFIELFVKVENTSVPPELVFEKLKEGAAKRVPSFRLIKALEEEIVRLENAVSILDSTGYGRERYSDTYFKTLKLMSLMFLSSLSKPVVEDLFEAAHRERKTLAQASSLANAVFQVDRLSGLTDEELLRLGISLCNSKLPPSSYASIASIFLKGKVNRIQDSEILEFVSDVLEEGGGLIQLERELERRIRR